NIPQDSIRNFLACRRFQYLMMGFTCFSRMYTSEYACSFLPEIFFFWISGNLINSLILCTEFKQFQDISFVIWICQFVQGLQQSIHIGKSLLLLARLHHIECI